ncbi:hypothetical protein ACFQ2M_16685 [Kitasatospora saccharophila]|uniref:hypothetical protein n=1 Tax=Kitasatospora saccharophila TaxID=407973 RepID=UPI0036284AE9
MQQPEPLDRLGLARSAAAEFVLARERVAEVVPAAGDRVVAGRVEAVGEVLGAQRGAVEDGFADGAAEADPAAEDLRAALGEPVAEGVGEQLGELSVEPVSTARMRWTCRSWPSSPASACGSQRAPSCETITAVTKWRG